MLFRAIGWLLIFALVLLFIDYFEIPYGSYFVDKVNYECDKFIGKDGTSAHGKCTLISGDRYKYSEPKTFTDGDEKFKIFDEKEVVINNVNIDNPIIDVMKLPPEIFQRWEFCIEKLKTITNGENQFPPDKIGLVMKNEEETKVIEKLIRGNESSCKPITETGAALSFTVIQRALFNTDVMKPKLENGGSYHSKTTAKFVMKPIYRQLSILVLISAFTIVGGFIILIIKIDKEIEKIFKYIFN